MIPRKITDELWVHLQEFPAVTLLGARQVGKTTIANEVNKVLGKDAVYFDLERPSDRAKLEDAEVLLEKYQDHCVIIDEAQVLPSLFTVLRPLIDANRRPGRFLLLGSIAPDMVKGISETLAGRVSRLEMGSINLLECLDAGISQEVAWFRGGYPGALMASSNYAFLRWAKNYYLTFAERDVNFLMNESLSPSSVKKLWYMLASINGTLWNTEHIARSMGLSRQTVNRYSDFMEAAFLIHRLQAFSTNSSKRLVKSPKVYFRDTGILHYLCHLQNYDQLLSHFAVGGSWEGYVVEQIKQATGDYLDLYFYRTHHGAEADLILAAGNTPVACIDVKLNNAPTTTRGFYEVISDLKCKHNYLITPNSDLYSKKGGIKVCSLSHFLRNELPDILNFG